MVHDTKREENSFLTFSSITGHSKVFSVQGAKTFINLGKFAVITSRPKLTNGIHAVAVYFSFL